MQIPGCNSGELVATCRICDPWEVGPSCLFYLFLSHGLSLCLCACLYACLCLHACPGPLLGPCLGPFLYPCRNKTLRDRASVLHTRTERTQNIVLGPLMGRKGLGLEIHVSSCSSRPPSIVLILFEKYGGRLVQAGSMQIYSQP